MPHRRGKVILDRGMDIGTGEGGGQPAREGVEIAHLDLALARQFELPLQPGGELADQDRGEDVEREVDDLLRVADGEAVKRREEEKGRGKHPERGRGKRDDTSPQRIAAIVAGTM